MAEQNDLPLRGSGFNTDPQTGDWDQLAYENHSLIERVRGENTDTDDAFAIYVQGVSTTTKVFNILKTGAIYVGSTNTAGLSATAGITLGAAAAAGSGDAALRYDATILAFAATLPSPVEAGGVGSPGSSSLASRLDHFHPGTGLMASTALPAGASSGLPALIFGTTNVAGSTGSFVDVGATVQLYDTTSPRQWSYGDAVVQGVGSFAARADHGHGFPSMPVISLSASGAALLSGTVNLVAGSGIALSQSGQGITITASAAAGNTLLPHTYDTTSFLSTTSTTFVLAGAMQISMNPAVSANWIRYTFAGDVYSSATNSTSIAIVDTTASVMLQRGIQKADGSNSSQPFNITRLKTDNFTGARTIEVQWLNDGSTSNINLNGQDIATLIVEEYR